ncbi:MAG: NUDIX hydrolase [Hyphomonadaceae bacterium]
MPFDIDTSQSLAIMSAVTTQVAAIPIRWTSGRPEVLLITTRGAGRWTVPKGWPLVDSIGAECAQREAFEEAGVRGAVEPYSLGTYEYWKNAKQGRVILQVTAFALHVDRILQDWPERAERKRTWFSPEVAAKLAANEQLGVLIKAAAQIGAPTLAWRERTPVRAAGLAN